jgi:hypothetical protein
MSYMLSVSTLNGKSRIRITGFLSVVILWILLTFFCYSTIIVFDSTTLGGAMLLGFILTSSVLSIIHLLKMIYDRTYSALTEED